VDGAEVSAPFPYAETGRAEQALANLRRQVPLRSALSGARDLKKSSSHLEN